MLVFNEYSKIVHNNNVENGWWEERRSIPKKMKESGIFTETEMEFVESLISDQLTLLQISELVESMEARRNRKVTPDMEAFENDLSNGVDFKTAFKTHVKDTYWDEKADTLIRLFDEFGSVNIDMEEMVELKGILVIF